MAIMILVIMMATDADGFDDDLAEALRAAYDHADAHHDPTTRGAFRAGAAFVVEHLDNG